MIHITIAKGAKTPDVVITDQAGTRLPFGGSSMLYRTQPSGNWYGKGSHYMTARDRENLGNEARQFADGFAEGVRCALYLIGRVADHQPRVEYDADPDGWFSRRDAESKRNGET